MNLTKVMISYAKHLWCTAIALFKVTDAHLSNIVCNPATSCTSLFPYCMVSFHQFCCIITNRAYRGVTLQILLIILKANRIKTNIGWVIQNLYYSLKDRHLQPSKPAHSVNFTVIIFCKTNGRGKCKTARQYDKIFKQNFTIM